MDPRVRDHADVIVDHSVNIQQGDEVIVSGHPVAEDLVVAIAERCGERGANLTTRLSNSRVDRAYRRAIDADDATQSDVSLASVEAADVIIMIRSDGNTFETSDVDPETNSAIASPPTRFGSPRATRPTSRCRLPGIRPRTATARTICPAAKYSRLRSRTASRAKSCSTSR